MHDTMVNFTSAAFGDLERLRREFEALSHAPGLDAAKIEVTIDRGVLTLAGERAPSPASAPGRKASACSRERPCGAFRRTISLPDDIDPAQTNAGYRDGVPNVSIARREAAQPQRITLQ